MSIVIYMEYVKHIPYICYNWLSIMLSGFSASHVFRQPVQVDSDYYRAPDPVDDADFELSNGNTLVEAFMAGLA